MAVQGSFFNRRAPAEVSLEGISPSLCDTTLVAEQKTNCKQDDGYGDDIAHPLVSLEHL